MLKKEASDASDLALRAIAHCRKQKGRALQRPAFRLVGAL
jgi:hypothetical protein